MDDYDVLVIDDDQMRDDWMLLEHEEGTTLVLRRGAVGSLRTYAEAWAAFRMLSRPQALPWRDSLPAAV